MSFRFSTSGIYAGITVSAQAVNSKIIRISSREVNLDRPTLHKWNIKLPNHENIDPLPEAI